MKPEKQKILDKLEQARLLIPSDNLPDLPVDKALGVPVWYEFERHIWAVGEDIRQIMVTYPILRKDKELQEAILEISCNEKAKRGRQSFIMLLGYKFCSVYASKLISQINDEYVDGHIVVTILKMQSPDFVNQIKPFVNHRKSWLRNYAKKYIEKFA